MEYRSEYTPSGATDRETTQDTTQLEDELLRREELQIKITEQVLGAYQDIWNQFYNWEPEASERDLANLASGIYLLDETPLQDEDSLEFQELDEQSSDDMSIDNSSPSFTVYDFDTNSTRTLLCTEKKLKPYAPYPRYFACTPTSCNIVNTHLELEGEGNHERVVCVLKFIPFDGEIGFKVIDYLRMEEFRTLRWQDEWRDPDEQIIADATIKQLTPALDVYMEEEPDLFDMVATSDIDAILPFTCKDVNFFMTQRDSLYWTGAATFDENPNPRRIPQSVQQGLYEHVLKTMQQYFCPCLNCLQFFCIHHPNTPWAAHHPTPFCTNEEIAMNVNQPCGPSCFYEKNMDELDLPEAIPFVIQEILQLAPDGSPCELSVICKRPCYEIYLYRTRCLSNDIVFAERENQLPTRRIQAHFDYINTSVNDYSMLYPCTHLGPCGPHVNCNCYAEGKLCMRNCHCDLSCPLRYTGCFCLNNKKCGNLSCACYKKNWECDPELCRMANTKANKNKKKKEAPMHSIAHICMENMGLQTGHIPQMEVKQGNYGFGVFAINNIKKGTFLGEYVAEVFHRIDVTRQMIWDYTDLNYNFLLSSSQALDAITVGNFTRFFNHDKKGGNVYPKVFIVNGDHRIAFYASEDLVKGTELMFYYGPNYWPEDNGQ
ncbi:hypothetical protein QCA50_011880 [Cerrena zonata]|uniref:SET domain-containing protein n=1 Tax=Cerrena zonata TaxID=2478898 RepID=A0AAW0G3S5_9APHY